MFTCIQGFKLSGEDAVVKSGQGQGPHRDGLQQTVGTARGADDDVQDKRKVEKQVVALSEG